MISDICELYKLLYNPLRLEMLRRIYNSRDGMNVGQLVDEMMDSGIKQSCVSQYLKQLEGVGIILRRRAGKYVNYFFESAYASPNVRSALHEIVRRLEASPKYDFEPIFCALMNPFRAAAVRAIALVGHMDGDTICAKFAHQKRYLKRDLQAAVDAGMLVIDDSDELSYRFVHSADPIVDKLIALCR